MTTVSWIMLTHNRADVVRECFDHNRANAGVNWDEFVWCDNGSSLGQDFDYLADYVDTAILNKHNLGVAKGYNRAMGLATKDAIVITGCDCKMPNGWLRTFKDYLEKVPNTGVACMYSRHWTEQRERLRKGYGIDETNALPLVHAMPVERRIFRRELLRDFGYFPEDFGLYSYDDLAWAYRAEKVCDEKGLLYYVIPDMVAEHIGTEGVHKRDGVDDDAYHAFKAREAKDPAKKTMLEWYRKQGWPRFTPYL